MLLRPKLAHGESEAGYWLRLAFLHGVANPRRMPEATGPSAINARVKLCPACLSQPTASWKARWTSAALWCELHSVWLVDRCAACDRRWTWANVRFDRCACGAAHAQRAVQSLPLGLCHSMETGEWQMETLRWIGALALDGLRSRPAKKASTHDMQVTATQATRGYELARRWPEGWSQLLDDLRVPSRPSEGPRHFNAEWPRLLAKIRAVRNAADRTRMEAATHAYVQASRGSQAPIVGRNVAPAPTLRILASDAGMGLRRLTAALAKAQAPTSGGRTRRRRVVAVPATVFHAEAQRKQAVSRAAAARTLGLSSGRVDRLVGDLLRSTPFGLGRASVVSFGASVTSAPAPNVALSSFRRLGEAMRLQIPSEATLQFIRAVQRGELGPLRGTSGSRIGDLLVDVEAVRSWWGRRERVQPKVLTLREVARALDIKEEVVTQLVRAGLIETLMQSCGRRKARVVRQDELDSFSAAYCKLKTLADASAVPARRAYQWAVEIGVIVVTGPLVDGQRQYFVRRPQDGIGGGCPPILVPAL